jgi:hypothetical protein
MGGFLPPRTAAGQKNCHRKLPKPDVKNTTSEFYSDYFSYIWQLIAALRRDGHADSCKTLLKTSHKPQKCV